MFTKFHLENPRKESYAYLRCTVKLGQGEYYRFYIEGERIKPSDWDAKNQKVKKSALEHSSINLMLDRLRYQINEKRRALFVDNNLSKHEIKKYIDTLLGKTPNQFWQAWDQLVKEKSYQQSSASRNLLPEKYKNIQRKLYQFDKELTFRAITVDFIHRWVAHLYEEYDISTNTAARYVKFLKTFMNESRRRGFHDRMDYKDFSIKLQPVLNPYLTVEELNKLYNLRCSDAFLENVRINLLKGCYSGQRHSDWEKINPSNLIKLEGSDYFHIMQTKTKSQVLIPVHEKLRAVVALPHHAISNQKFNIYAKLVCQEAGIDDPFIKPSYKGNKIENIVFKKHELVASHIARRTFVCNSLKQGVNTEMIMKVGGWKSYSSFKNYVQLSSADGMDQFDNVFN